MKNKNIYLDNHASTKIDIRVFEKMRPFLTEIFGNPHSDSHSHGWITKKYVWIGIVEFVIHIGLQMFLL